MPAPATAFAALEAGLEEKRLRVEDALRRLTVPGRSRAVEAAVESSLFAPAKRLRPILALMVADVLHGDADAVIPVRFGRTLFEAARDPKEAHFIPGGGHADLYDFGIDRVILDFLGRHLAVKAAAD